MLMQHFQLSRHYKETGICKKNSYNSMRKEIRSYFLAAFMILCGLAFSQDLIIKNDGTKVYCKIVDQNAGYLYYTRQGNNVMYNLQKTDVQNFYFEKKENPPAAAPAATTTPSKPE